MSELTLYLFGSFQARLQGQTQQKLRTKAVQALLIYLAMENDQPQQREQLMTLLWPYLPAKSARSNLRQNVYFLRKSISKLPTRDGTGNAPFLLSDRQTLQLNPAVDWESDAGQFTRLLAQTQQHKHPDLLTCLECHQHIQAAVDLYRDPFLADFYLPDSNPFEDWAHAKREYLRRQALDALECLAFIYTQQGAYPKAQTMVQRQLAIDDLCESAYRQYMGILALNGQRSEALAQYNICRHRLQEELGMAPTAQTTALYQQIVSGEIEMPPTPQQRIRGYELQEEIGVGAFGAVYRAFQPVIDREVAIKVIHPRFANQADFIRRFETEAQIVACLEHPYIVPLYDYWREPKGAYLVMRWLRGGTLKDKLQRESLPLSEVVRLLNQVAAALHAAHSKGIIHRDLKPANILLDEEGNAYLSDFGIARDVLASHGQRTQKSAVVGSPIYISPEQILSEPLTPAADIYCLGILLYELLVGKRPFPDDIPTSQIYHHLNEPLPLLQDKRPDLSSGFDDVLQRATTKQPKHRFPTALALAEAFQAAAQGRMVQPPSPTRLLELGPDVALVNPYCGLKPFQETDAAFFHGREALVDQLLTHFEEPKPAAQSRTSANFMAIVGPSGSGKSSVVKAGLIPALRRGALPGSEKWFIIQMAPGSHPLEELETALLRIAVNPPPSLLEPLQKDARGLLRTVMRVLPPENDAAHPGRLLLLIDQFEELFTLVEDKIARTHFLDSLVTAVTDPRSPLRLLVTLRADFYDRPLQYPAIGQLLRQNTELVLPLTPAELEQAISRPAQQAGVDLEPGLVPAIIADVIDQPGALPLLQYALTELFEKRQGRLLTHSAYTAIGGVLGALGRRAEAVYASLSPTDQEITRQHFLRLVTLGEGVEDTRRRVRHSELTQLTTSPIDSRLQHPSEANQDRFKIHHSLYAFGGARLLTFDRDPLTRGPTVEVAHEALLREWPRLRGWLDDSRQGVRLQRQLATAAAEWRKAEKDPGFLLRGSWLDQLEGWAAESELALTGEEQSFLDASLQARWEREAVEEARRQRELETARQLAREQTRRAEEQARAAQSLRQRALILASALVIAAVLAIVAFGFSRASTSNANLAATREAEALANLNLAATTEASAVNNANLANTREAEADVERAIAVSAQEQAQAEANIRATAEAMAVNERQFAQNQQALAEEQLRLTSSRELALAASANLNANPERSILLALQALDNAYSTEAEEMLRAALQTSRVQLTLAEDDDHVDWVAYHPEGTWLAGIGNNGILIIWDAQSGEKLQTIPLDITNTGRLSISPDGSLIAVVSQNRVQILESDSLTVFQELDDHFNDVIDIDFSPDSTLLASGDKDGVLNIWQVDSGEVQIRVTASDVGWVNDVTFSRDGSRLATTGDDATTRIWDVVTGEELLRMPYNALWMHSVAFNLNDTRLFTVPGVSENGSEIVVWDIENNSRGVLTEPLAEWSGIHSNLITTMKISPDGRFLATASQDSTVKLRDATSEDGQEIMTLSGQPGMVKDISFNTDSQTLASTSFGAVCVWNISESGYGEVLNIAESSIPVAIRSDTQSLVSLADDGLVQIWDMHSGKLLETIDTLISEVHFNGSAVSSDGRYMAIGGNDNIIKIINLNTQKEIASLTGHGSGITGFVFSGIIALDFSPDGSLLASGGADGFVMLWDAKSGEKLNEWRVDPRNSYWPGYEDYANGVANVQFSPDGRFLAVSTDESEDSAGNEWALIKIWDLESGQVITVVEEIPHRIWGLAFSPDSKHIAGTGRNGFIKIWNVTTGEQMANFEGATTTILNVVFSTDGNRLITGGDQLVIWDIVKQEIIFRLPKGVKAPILSAGGQYLAATGTNGIHIYTLDFDELVKIAQSRVTRSLTEAECQQYLHLDTCPGN